MNQYRPRSQTRHKYRLSSSLLVPVLLMLLAAAVEPWAPAAAQQRTQAEASDAARALSRTAPPPPATRMDTVRDTLHGTVLTDPYRWLEEKQADATRAWIEKQNAYSDSIFASLPGRKQISERMAELLTVDATEQPVVRGDRYFFRKREADQEQYVLYVRNGPDGEDRVLVDPHEMDPEHKTSVQLMEVSEDGSLLAYGVREGGEDEVAPRFLDVETGESTATAFPKGRYFGMEITPGNEAVYYTRVVEGEGPRVFRHEFGTPVEDDAVVFGSDYGPDKIISQFLSPDGRYLGLMVLYGAGASQTELHYKDLERGGPVRTILPEKTGRRSSPSRSQ